MLHALGDLNNHTHNLPNPIFCEGFFSMPSSLGLQWHLLMLSWQLTIMRSTSYQNTMLLLFFGDLTEQAVEVFQTTFRSRTGTKASRTVEASLIFRVYSGWRLLFVQCCSKRRHSEKRFRDSLSNFKYIAIVTTAAQEHISKSLKLMK